jgi:hypothetical protein
MTNTTHSYTPQQFISAAQNAAIITGFKAAWMTH